MRPIKFRAWIKNTSMVNVLAINLKPTSPDRHIFTDLDYSVFWVGENEYVLMQFTGLHDKNGKEIWEGDVVRWLSHFHQITVDEYHGFRFMWGKDELCRAHGIEGEVLGNIYENPELLNEK